MAYVIFSLTRTFRQSVDASGQMCLVELYSRLTWIVVVTYSLYAIVWLFSQGFPSFSVTLEVVAYSLLDVINKVQHPPPPPLPPISFPRRLQLPKFTSFLPGGLHWHCCQQPRLAGLLEGGQGGQQGVLLSAAKPQPYDTLLPLFSLSSHH